MWCNLSSQKKSITKHDLPKISEVLTFLNYFFFLGSKKIHCILQYIKQCTVCKIYSRHWIHLTLTALSGLNSDIYMVQFWHFLASFKLFKLQTKQLCSLTKDRSHSSSQPGMVLSWPSPLNSQQLFCSCPSTKDHIVDWYTIIGWTN